MACYLSHANACYLSHANACTCTPTCRQWPHSTRVSSCQVLRGRAAWLTRTRACALVCVRVYVCMYLYMCMYSFMHVCACACIYVFMFREAVERRTFAEHALVLQGANPLFTKCAISFSRKVRSCASTLRTLCACASALRVPLFPSMLCPSTFIATAPKLDTFLVV